MNRHAHSHHLTIVDLEAHLSKIGAGSYGTSILHAYVETGRHKPYTEATVRAAKQRGYRVEHKVAGVYYVYPKQASREWAQTLLHAHPDDADTFWRTQDGRDAIGILGL